MVEDEPEGSLERGELRLPVIPRAASPDKRGARRWAGAREVDSLHLSEQRAAPAGRGAQERLSGGVKASGEDAIACGLLEEAPELYRAPGCRLRGLRHPPRGGGPDREPMTQRRPGIKGERPRFGAVPAGGQVTSATPGG